MLRSIAYRDKESCRCLYYFFHCAPSRGLVSQRLVTAHGGDKTFGWVKSNSEAKAVTTSYTIQDVILIMYIV
jgi:hypothetical protein